MKYVYIVWTRDIKGNWLLLNIYEKRKDAEAFMKAEAPNDIMRLTQEPIY